MGTIIKLETLEAGSLANPAPINENFEKVRVAINDNASSLADCIKDDGSSSLANILSYAISTITNATNATPIVITAAGHGRSTGDSIFISGVLGNTAANGTYTITKVDDNSFSLNSSVGNAAYTSGGTVYLLPKNLENITNKAYVDNSLTTVIPRNYIDGLTLACNSTTLTGTVATTASSATLTGTSTLFTTEAPVGSILVINGISYAVTAVASNTSLTLSATVATAYLGLTIFAITNKITIGTGVCSDSTNTVKITMPTFITKKLDAVWLVGTGNGGLDIGTKTINTWYNVFAIAKADGTTDVLYSLSNTNPTLPSGYSYFRRVGSIKTDSNGNIIQFVFNPNDNSFRYRYRITDFSGTTTTTYADLVLSVPSDTIAILTGTFSGSNAGPSHYLKSKKTSCECIFDGYASAGYSSYGCIINIDVDSASKIQYKSSSASSFGLYALGYIDSRGKN